MNEKTYAVRTYGFKRGELYRGGQKAVRVPALLKPDHKGRRGQPGSADLQTGTRTPSPVTPAGALYVKAAKQISTISTNLAKQVEELDEEFGKIRLGNLGPEGHGAAPLPLIPGSKAASPTWSWSFTNRARPPWRKASWRVLWASPCRPPIPRDHDELVDDLIQKENMVLLVNKILRPGSGTDPPGTPIDIREAADEVFKSTSRQGHSARTILDALCTARNMKPEIGLETISIEVGKYVVATSPVVMACPDAYADTENSLQSPYYTYPILGVENPRHFFACYRKDLYLTKYMRYFLELLHEVRNLPAGRHGQTPGAEAQSLIGIPTELPQMLNAREQRAALQNRLLGSCRCPLVSFTLNIPGPVKVLPLFPRPLTPGSLRSKTPWQIRDSLWSAGNR